MNIVFIVIFQLIYFSNFIYSKETCEFKVQKTENKQLIEKNIESLSPMGIQHCSKQCSTTSGCLSFNYYREHLTCELNFASKKTETLVKDDQSDYYDNNDKAMADIGGCSNMTCLLHSRCIDIKDYGPHCYIFECSEPTPIDNATLHPGEKLVGSTRQYTCQNFPTCSKSITCKSDGRWTAISLLCETEFFCEADWSLFADSCYNYMSILMSWGDAMNECINNGGYLVRIESVTENEYVKSLARAEPYSYHWIDGTDAVKEGTWKYGSSGSILNFNDWGPGEPSNGSAQHCVVLSRGYNYRWNDIICTSRYCFICEKSAMERLVNVC